MSLFFLPISISEKRKCFKTANPVWQQIRDTCDRDRRSSVLFLQIRGSGSSRGQADRDQAEGHRRPGIRLLPRQGRLPHSGGRLQRLCGQGTLGR